MAILLLGLLFILDTTAITLFFAVYYTSSKDFTNKLLCLSVSLVVVNILVNAIVFAIIF